MTFEKAPSDILDFTWDWSSWLSTGDTISSVAWDIPETYMDPPQNMLDSPSTNGGAFTAGAYYWVVTGVNDAGETTASNTVTATLSGTQSSVGLGWNPVEGATGYNVYRGSNTSGTPVTVDTSGTGAIGVATGSPTTSPLTANGTWTKGSSANYAVATVAYLCGSRPSLITCTYGSNAMQLLGWNTTSYGGVAFFGLANPQSGSQAVNATVTNSIGVVGVVVSTSTYIGWGSTVNLGTAGGRAGSPSQTIPAVYGDMVLWAAVNLTGSNISAAITSVYPGTVLQNTGSVTLPLQDQMGLVTAYQAGGSSGPSEVSFSANVTQANIDQFWAASALILLPAAPPINALITSITDPTVTQYTDTGITGTSATPPGTNTALTSISQPIAPTPSNTATTATVWLTNGTAGEATPVTCQINTTAGRVASNTQTVNVVNL